MGIYDSRRWYEDLDVVIRSFPELQKMEGKTVLITGATGLIGSAAADLLLRYNETAAGEAIRVMIAGRNPEKADSRFHAYIDKSYYRFVPFDATDGKLSAGLRFDYVIHGASPAYPGRIVKEPVETMCSNFDGLLGLLKAAKAAGACRILFISSSEVYGRKENALPYKEGEYGYVDLLSPRNSYSVAKRAAETLCAAFADEYGMEYVVIRPGHIYGPTASPEDDRVSSAFAYKAAAGEDMVLKSAGTQMRSYVYCIDSASAILKALLCGKTGEAYNISDRESVISIRQMADILAKAGNVKLTYGEANAADRKGFNPMDNSALDGTKLAELGWKACFTAQEGLAHTVQVLQEARQR